jgi:N-acetylgalactosamine 4-sulfate 6-O-sulfotransferase
MNKGKHVAMDVSPGLLFHSDVTSYSILCVSPWSKIVIVLRNPVDRLYQQWVYSVVNLGLSLSLEDWMAQEMKVMQSVGLIDAGGTKTSLPISEKDAWKKYQSIRTVGGAAIGRSLYVFQLEDWIQTYVEAGLKPADEILILASEDVESNPTQQYTALIDFLGLAPINVTKIGTSLTSLGTKPTPPKNVEPMKPETRKMLEQFFRPYNQRLARLLKSNGFKGNWDKIWK